MTFLNIIFRATFFLLLITTSFQIAVPQANAQKSKDIFDRFRKPMPELKLMEEAEFLKKTRAERQRPYGDETLEYAMQIPKTFTDGADKGSSNFMLSEKLFQELSVYYGKPTISGRSRIEIQALNIDSSLTAEQWYLKYILESGYTTEGFVVHSDKRVESLMVYMEKDFSYYLRTLTVINGKKVIMVKYYVPVDYIQKQAVMQSQVINSFRVVNEIKRPEPEFQVYRFLDVAEIQYPENWKAYSKPMRSVDRMDVTLMNVTEVKDRHGHVVSTSTEGRMDVTLVSSFVQGSLVEEVGRYKQKLEASGMLIGDKIKTFKDVKYSEGIDFGITEIYSGVDSSNSVVDYEFWFTVMVGGNYYYFMTMLTPSRNERFGVWAENTQNYKMMVNRFGLMSGAFIERD